MSDISIGDLIASFGTPKEEPPPAVADANQWLDGLRGWLGGDYEPLVHKPRSGGLHASGLGKVCGRRELVIEAFGATYVPNTAGNYFTFDMGHALHFWWQERYLGPRQELRGEWMCVACSCPTCKGGKRKKKTCPDCRRTGRKVTIGLMPMNCECGVPWQDAIRYLELPVVHEELNYVGHCDGILIHKPKERLFELKSMSPSEYEKWCDCAKPRPKPDHVVQAHAYMGPLGLEETLIVYVNKGSQCKWKVDRCGQFVAGEPKVKPFLIQWDQGLWDGIVVRIHDWHKATKILQETRASGKRLPRAAIETLPRVCDSMKCDMAQRCPVTRECFSLGVPE